MCTRTKRWKNFKVYLPARSTGKKFEVITVAKRRKSFDVYLLVRSAGKIVIYIYRREAREKF